MLKNTTVVEAAPRENNLPSYLTPRDIEEELRLSRSTVYRLLRSGELPHVRFRRKIRVRREVFEEWSKEQEHQSMKKAEPASPAKSVHPRRNREDI